MKAIVSALVLALAVTGCSLPAQLKSSPAVRYYVLSSSLPASSSTESAGIGVLPVTLPGYLTRQQIVLRDADGINITINEYDRWGESLGQGISRVLCDALAVHGIPALPLRTGAKVTDKLMLDVRRLDGPLEGNVTLDVVWRLQRDGDVLKCLRMLTFLPLEQIDEMDKWEGSQLNTAKEILAYELTKLVHGEEEAAKAQEAARALFGGGGDSANMPCTKLCREDFTAEGEIDILTLLVKCGLAASRGEARRLVQQGGVAVCGQKVADIEAKFSCKDCCGEGAVIKKGKKVYHKAILEE